MLPVALGWIDCENCQRLGTKECRTLRSEFDTLHFVTNGRPVWELELSGFQKLPKSLPGFSGFRRL